MFEVEKWVERDGQEFKLRCMDGLQELELLGGLTKGERIPAARIGALLESCIVDWKNARGSRDQVLGDFDPRKVRWLPAWCLDWLASEVLELSQPTEEEKKTSSDLPSSEDSPPSSPAAIAHV